MKKVKKVLGVIAFKKPHSPDMEVKRKISLNIYLLFRMGMTSEIIEVFW